jgi:hypothetical protein
MCNRPAKCPERASERFRPVLVDDNRACEPQLVPLYRGSMVKWSTAQMAPTRSDIDCRRIMKEDVLVTSPFLGVWRS